MGFSEMPEVLLAELAKALAGNVYAAKEKSGPKDNMAAAWKEYMKEDKRENKKREPAHCLQGSEICSPKKVKFIFVLNNAVVINMNAIAEE